MQSGVCVCQTEQVCSAPWSSTPSSGGKGAPVLAGFVLGGFAYSDPEQERRNRLVGWVDFDYESDPNTRKSVTGYALGLNNVPISWKAKRQDCM
eukprot:500412-Rhodomonas_salina.1